MNNNLGRTYAVRIETLSPIHIGCGRSLQRDLDFVVQNNTTYRLNEQAVLDAYWPDDPRDQPRRGSRPGDLVRDVSLARKPTMVAYSYAGVPAMGKVNEHIKTVFGEAYIPGASLKGALRTLLMRTIREGVQQRDYTRSDIGSRPRDSHERDRASKAAANRLERDIAGADPNHSLFRGLHVSDTSPAPQTRLKLQRVQMRPDLDIDVEAIASGTQLDATIRVDRYTLLTLGERLGFESPSAKTVVAFARAANFTARSRVQQEYNHHSAVNETQAAQFYLWLNSMLKEQDFDKKAFLLQVGFATGWRSKTLIGGVPNDNPLIAQVVNEFELNMGGKRGKERDEVEPLQPGDVFPVARHLAYVGDRAALPMGWVRVNLT